MTRLSSENPLWGTDWPQVRALWPLDPSVAHLNHGSFGAVPSPVLAEQDRWRTLMDSNPTGFFWRFLPDALDNARVAVARFLRADPDGFVFATNATTAINTILASLELTSRDEVLVTDHGYGAIRLAAERACKLSGATLVVHPVPLPVEGAAELVDAVIVGITDRTMIAIVDHIASPTGVVFPVADLVRELRGHEVLSLIDGAHAPGMVALDLCDLDADFWTGNFHKWCCAPRGAAGLYVRADHRERIAPLVTSREAEGSFVKSFGWLGTADYTPYLTVPAAIGFMEDLGWERLRRHNRELAAYGAAVVRDALDTPAPTEADVFEGMSLLALPEGSPDTIDGTRALSARIAEELGAEVAAFPWRDHSYIRLSAQAYNAPAEYEALAAGLPRLLS
ncbi:MAG TPA: aminotransferase class V-fold PLP-dependent enzyme [Actinomycetota bacterium]|nr:aminotransferase class V-fold PLP-dependent enzyme [Actinomycetota bacterium]